MSDHFLNFQYREQDLLNFMVFYMSEPFGGQWKVRHLDDDNKWHGLVWKGYEPMVELRKYSPKVGKEIQHLILPQSNENWPDEDKEVVVWHVAGGNMLNKMNYRLRFKPEVVKYLDKLVKP